MTKKAKAAASGTAELREETAFRRMERLTTRGEPLKATGVKGGYTTTDLSSAGHGVACAQCPREAVISIGVGRFWDDKSDPDWGATNQPRCERHLTHVGAL